MQTPTRAHDVHGALDLPRTLRGIGMWTATPWLRVDASGGWYAARTEDGPGTVQMWMEDGRLLARGWGPGADHVLDQVPRLAGLHDDPAALVPLHPIVARLQRQCRGTRMGATDRIFPSLVAVILAQKVTGKESTQAVRRIADRWGDPAPGPRDDLRLLPSPRTLRDTPYAAFHPMGVERRRARVVIEAARRAGRLEEAAGMTDTDAAARLVALPGIGPWTAGVVASAALGHPDAVPVGDYHLPNVVSHNLVGEPRADDARMLELLAPYAGQRGRVARLLARVGAPPPKWGPRSEARDIRSI